ncbi:MAG: hypothetical protein WD534_04850 [Phycisphaeraceae bacterium]
MHFDELTPEQIDALVDTRHATTDIAFPPQGLQPYHQWLIRTLHRLAECSLAALRVGQADEGPMVVAIAPGRASIDGDVLVYAGGTLDLATFNNATARIALVDDDGSAAVAADSDWPAALHIKLAEVELSEGAITTITDRRLETVFRV